MKLIQCDPGFFEIGGIAGNLSIKGPEPLLSPDVPEQDKAPRVEHFRLEMIKVMGEDQPSQFISVHPLGIVHARSPVHNAYDLHFRAAREQESHGVSRHISVRSSRESDGKGIRVDVGADFLHGDFRRFYNSSGRDTVFLVVDADSFAGHDADTQKVFAPYGLPGDPLDHGIVHVLVRPQFDGLILPVIVHNTGVDGLALFRHKDIEEGIDEAVLDLVEVLGDVIGRIELDGIQDGHHLRSALVDVLGFEMLGVGQDKGFPEKGVGVGDVLVFAPGDDGPKPAPGDIRKTDMIAQTVTAEKKGDPEGGAAGEILGEIRAKFCQVGRVQPKGQGVLFGHKKIGFQGTADKGDTGHEDGPAEFVQIFLSRVVFLQFF